MHSRINVGIVVVVALLAVVCPVTVARAQSKGSTELWVRFSDDANKDVDDGESAQLRRAVGQREPLANTGENAQRLMACAALAISGAALLCARELRTHRIAWRTAFYKAALMCCLLVPLTSFLAFSAALADVLEEQPSTEVTEINEDDGEEQPSSDAQLAEEEGSHAQNLGGNDCGEGASSDEPLAVADDDQRVTDKENTGALALQDKASSIDQNDQQATSANGSSLETRTDGNETAKGIEANDPEEAGEVSLDLGELDFSTARLLVGMASRPEVGEVVSSSKNVWLLRFATQKDAIAAYEELLPLAEFVVPDQAMAIDGGPASDEVGPLANLAALDNTERFREDVVVLVDTGVCGYTANAQVCLSVIGTTNEDDNGHGTQMARALVDLDSSTLIVSIKAADAHSQATVASVYAAIHKAINMRAKVVSLPWSAKVHEGIAVLEQAIRDAYAAGVMVVTAAGDNANDAQGYFPAKMGDEAVVVGSCDANGTRSASSNYGQTVDLFIPAESASIAAARASAWLCANGQFGQELESLNSAEARRTFGFEDSQHKDSQVVEMPLEEPAGNEERQSKGLFAKEQLLATKDDAASVNGRAVKGEDEACQIRMTVPVGIHYVVQNDGVAVGPNDGDAYICNKGEVPIRIKEASVQLFAPYKGDLGFVLSNWRVDPGDTVDLLGMRGTMVSHLPLEQQVGSIHWTFEVDE